MIQDSYYPDWKITLRKDLKRNLNVHEIETLCGDSVGANFCLMRDSSQWLFFTREEAGIAGFERYKADMTREKRANPYTLYLVDWEKEIAKAEYTELPAGFEGFPLTENKA